jgi:hypothetical protein
MTLVRDPRRLVLVITMVVLAGATVFGLWHVVVGGLVNGNARAAAFGVVLAIASGGLLSALLARTRDRPGRPGR